MGCCEIIEFRIVFTVYLVKFIVFCYVLSLVLSELLIM